MANAVLTAVMIIVLPVVTKFIIDNVIVGHRRKLLLPAVRAALLQVAIVIATLFICMGC